MNLAATIAYRALLADAAPDHYETYYGFQPIPHQHPPSLKRPQKVKVDEPAEGWRMGDSKKARAKAMADLVEVHKRLLRQFGKPEMARTAINPVPSLFTPL